MAFRKELRFRQVSVLPIPRRFIAICTPWGVCYHRPLLDDRLRRHEQCHWEQYQRYGVFLFPLLYLFESIKHGYRNNRFEIEARSREFPAPPE